MELILGIGLIGAAIAIFLQGIRIDELEERVKAIDGKD